MPSSPQPYGFAYALPWSFTSLSHFYSLRFQFKSCLLKEAFPGHSSLGKIHSLHSSLLLVSFMSLHEVKETPQHQGPHFPPHHHECQCLVKAQNKASDEYQLFETRVKLFGDLTYTVRNWNGNSQCSFAPRASSSPERVWPFSQLPFSKMIHGQLTSVLRGMLICSESTAVESLLCGRI